MNEMTSGQAYKHEVMTCYSSSTHNDKKSGQKIVAFLMKTKTFPCTSVDTLRLSNKEHLL